MEERVGGEDKSMALHHKSVHQNHPCIGRLTHHLTCMASLEQDLVLMHIFTLLASVTRVCASLEQFSIQNIQRTSSCISFRFLNS